MTLTKHTEPGRQTGSKEHFEEQETQNISEKTFEYTIKAFWAEDKCDRFNLNSENPAARILERLSLNNDPVGFAHQGYVNFD